MATATRCTWLGHSPDLAQRIRRVGGVLDGVEGRDRVEGVVVRQVFYVALAQVCVWESFAGDVQEAVRGVQACRGSAPFSGKDEGESRSAACVEHMHARADPERVERSLVERRLCRFDKFRPFRRRRAPQGALNS